MIHHESILQVLYAIVSLEDYRCGDGGINIGWIFRFRTESKGACMTEQRERVERFSEELRERPEPSDRSIQEIVQALQPQIQELVNKQVELAKTELVPVGRRAGIAAGLLAVGAVIMFVFLIFLSLTGVYALALVLP